MITVEELANASKDRFEAVDEKYVSLERRVAALEAQDEFCRQITKLDLKPGQIIVLGTNVVFNQGLRENISMSISKHVGFYVPVMVMNPDDTIAVINPEEVKKDA